MEYIILKIMNFETFEQEIALYGLKAKTRDRGISIYKQGIRVHWFPVGFSLEKEYEYLLRRFGKGVL